MTTFRLNTTLRRAAGAASLVGMAALATLAAAPRPAQAHDIVLVPSATGLTVRYGHPQDWQPVDIEKLLTLQSQGADGVLHEHHAALKRQGLDLRLKPGSLPGATLVAARYDNGLWVQLPTSVGAGDDKKPEWRNTSRFMMPTASGVTLSIKFAKALSATPADSTVYSRQVGHLLELVPQKNPLSIKPGETLPVLVLFDGKPLADAGIENSNLVQKLPEDKIPRYRTDANGLAQVPLRARGVNTLAVDLERPVNAALPGGALAAPADKLLVVATYTFVR